MASIDIPPSWDRSIARIVKYRWRKVLVVGATDRGKSTYCRVLAHRLGAAGFQVAFVDADIGQKDIGPPATISLAYPEAEADLAQARLAGLYFVGAVNPTGHLLPITVGTRRLVDAAKAPFVIIDTTGLIRGNGRILTAYQIESLQPEVIVAIERGRELEAIIRPYRYYNFIRLRPSPQVMSKSRDQRRAAREQAFRAYFQDARAVVLDLKGLVMQRCLLFTGRRFEDPRFLYAEQTSEGIIGVAAASPPVEQAGVQVLPAGFEQNRLCGLADRHGRGLGLAIVVALDFSKETIALLTPVPLQAIKILQFGSLYLDADGRERRDRSLISG